MDDKPYLVVEDGIIMKFAHSLVSSRKSAIRVIPHADSFHQNASPSPKKAVPVDRVDFNGADYVDEQVMDL